MTSEKGYNTNHTFQSVTLKNGFHNRLDNALLSLLCWSNSFLFLFLAFCITVTQKRGLEEVFLRSSLFVLGFQFCSSAWICLCTWKAYEGHKSGFSFFFYGILAVLFRVSFPLFQTACTYLLLLFCQGASGTSSDIFGDLLVCLLGLVEERYLGVDMDGRYEKIGKI